MKITKYEYIPYQHRQMLLEKYLDQLHSNSVMFQGFPLPVQFHIAARLLLALESQ